MDVLAAIKGRRSVRRFLEHEIEPAKIESLKEALIWAPSSGNLQARFFYFVFNDEVKKDLMDAALHQGFILEAPLVVVACADMGMAERYGKRGTELYCIQDVACSVENMMLAAYGLGLGSVWVGAFHDDEVAGCLDMPPEFRPVAIVPVGYPAEKPDAPERVDAGMAIKDVR